MASNWAVKELLAAVKMNQLTIPKYNSVEQAAIVDTARAAGMVNYHTVAKTLQVYQSGTGSSFDITELSNFLYKHDHFIGIGSTQRIVYSDKISNTKGKMNTNVIVDIRYKQETSVAGKIKISLVHSGTNIVSDNSFTSNASPAFNTVRYILDSSSIAVDGDVEVRIELLQMNVELIEVRGI